jgi:hypothetical protein
MKSNKRIVICICLLLSNCLISGVYAQGFKYKEVQDVPSFIRKYNEGIESARLRRAYKFIDARKYLPKGFVKDGSIDYTKYIQAALTQNENVIMPNFPVLISDSGIEIPSNRKVLFNVKSLLILKPSSKGNYEMLRIHNKENITLYSPKIEGDRNKHIGTTGEWGMGISIKSSKNIQILNSQISKCWGDGIYLGQGGSATNTNITINYGVLDNNRRNGISVISVEGLTIADLIISNTYGTNPQAGIDFEPNKNNERLAGININNLYTFNNKNQGMFFVLGLLRGTGHPIDINVVNYVDNWSLRSIGYHNMNNQSLKGKINIDNFDSKNSQESSVYVYKNSQKGQVDINVRSNNKNILNKVKNEGKVINVLAK